MSALNAGLPAAPASTAAPIGSTALYAEAGALCTLADGSVWLRTGTLASKSLYQAAGALPHMRAHIFTSAGSLTTVNGIATNGAGVYVCPTYPSSANINVSTNYGQTWTTVSHGMGSISVHAVMYAAGKFWAVANDSTSIYLSYSTNGTSWTNLTVASPTSPTANTAVIAYTGSLFVIAVVSSSTASSIYTSSVGTGSWSAQTAPGVFTSPIGIGANSVGVVITSNGSTTITTSTNGTTYSTQSVSGKVSTPVAGAPITSINGLLMLWGSSNYIYTPDLTNWTQVNPALQFSMQPLYSGMAGSRIVVPGPSGTNSFGYTSDGINWGVQSTSVDVGGVPYFMAGDSQALVLVGSTGSASINGYYASSTIDLSNAVGRAPTINVGSANAYAVGYVRVK